MPIIPVQTQVADGAGETASPLSPGRLDGPQNTERTA